MLPCHRRMVITIQFTGWLLDILWLSGHLGQLAPTTLPLRRLVSNLSLCRSLSHYPFALRASLSLCSVIFTLPRGFVLLHTLPRGFLSLFALPTGFSLSLSSLCLCLVLTPPSACRYNSGIPPFAWRRAQQRIKEPYSVPIDRECFLKQPYQISSTRQPHVQAVSIPTH